MKLCLNVGTIKPFEISKSNYKLINNVLLMYQFYLVCYTLAGINIYIFKFIDPSNEIRSKCLLYYTKEILQHAIIILKLLSQFFIKPEITMNQISQEILLSLFCDNSSSYILLPSLITGLCLYFDSLYPCSILIDDIVELCIEYDKFLRNFKNLKRGSYDEMKNSEKDINSKEFKLYDLSYSLSYATSLITSRLIKVLLLYYIC